MRGLEWGYWLVSRSVPSDSNHWQMLNSSCAAISWRNTALLAPEAEMGGWWRCEQRSVNGSPHGLIDTDLGVSRCRRQQNMNTQAEKRARWAKRPRTSPKSCHAGLRSFMILPTTYPTRSEPRTGKRHGADRSMIVSEACDPIRIKDYSPLGSGDRRALEWEHKSVANQKLGWHDHYLTRL